MAPLPPGKLGDICTILDEHGMCRTAIIVAQNEAGNEIRLDISFADARDMTISGDLSNAERNQMIADILDEVGGLI